MDGWISGDDLATIKQICSSVASKVEANRQGFPLEIL
jgi:hypothetical protein